MLAEAIKHLRADAADLHGEDIANWFIRAHIEQALTLEHFDPAIGFAGYLTIRKGSQVGSRTDV